MANILDSPLGGPPAGGNVAGRGVSRNGRPQKGPLAELMGRSCAHSWANLPRRASIRVAPASKHGGRGPTSAVVGRAFFAEGLEPGLTTAQNGLLSKIGLGVLCALGSAL